MTPLLRTASLTVRFGGLRANDDIDVSVDDGEVVGLIGPNGAGKTTFIDALTGFTPASGSIRFAGHELANRRPHERARLGLRRTWQSLELFDDLSIRDNLRVASDSAGRRWGRRDGFRPRRSHADGGVEFALDALGLAPLADRMPTALSQGQRKLVSTARALAGRPRMICMDEPAAGLDTTESAALGEQIRRIAGTGTTILIVDHDMRLLMGLCDRMYVLEFGAVIAEGAPHDVRSDPRVIEAYLGAHEPDQLDG